MSYRDVLARKGYAPVGYQETPKFGGDLVIRMGFPTYTVPLDYKPRDNRGRFVGRGG